MTDALESLDVCKRGRSLTVNIYKVFASCKRLWTQGSNHPCSSFHTLKHS